VRLPLIIALALSLSACSSGPTRIDAGGATSASRQTGAPDPRSPASEQPELRDDPAHAGADPAATTDVWQRIRSGLTLDRQLSQAVVREKLAFYARKQEFLDRVAERARPYLFHIVEELDKRNMPRELALLPIVESAYQPFAYSRSRASGIWQFIPSTGLRYGLKQNWWYDGRRDIVEATRAALDYLEKLNAEFNGDWLLALAAYNAGELNVQRAVNENLKAGRSTDFFSLRLPRETRGYVPSLLAVSELLANAERYGVQWQPIANQPHFTIVQIDAQIELATAARLANLSHEEFRHLNPGFNQWATDPDGPHRLLVPVGTGPEFAREVARLPPTERVQWQQHVVRNGENLGGISQRYHTHVDALRQANNLRGTLIHVGQVLLIPSGGRTPASALVVAGRNAAIPATSGPAPAASGATTYTVARGDSLWSISRGHGISVAQLCAWNSTNPRVTLRPGQKLKVRDDAGGTSAMEPAAIQVAYTDTPQATNYTVRHGDSLWNISRRFGVSVAELQQWNQLGHGSVLQPGQTLIVSQPIADIQDA
jgi:membrane-bound lytic murein transglycosylase D